TLADASRIAMGALDLEREPAILRHLVTEAVEVLDRDTRARIDRQGALADGAVGNWDRRALRRVITNLLTNAAKYSAPGSPIVVATEAAGDDVHLQVRDHGIGLLPA